METVILKNDDLEVSINLAGAEVSSVRNLNNNFEYIWQADPKVWKRHAPVLFPIVGKLKDDHFYYQDKEYIMGQHGFARDNVFEVVEKSDNYVSLVFKSNEETLNKYPFEFNFYVNYTLSGNSLLVNYQVVNPIDQEFYFGVGAHPGFNLPVDENNKFDDYYFEFSPSENRYQIPLVNSQIDSKNHKLVETKEIPITHDLFKKDALIFELEGANTVSVKNRNSSFEIDVSSDNAEYVGLWSPYPIEGDFVCIEPWWSIADDIDSSGKLEDKFAIKHLSDKDEEFNADYTITFKK